VLADLAAEQAADQRAHGCARLLFTAALFALENTGKTRLGGCRRRRGGEWEGYQGRSGGDGEGTHESSPVRGA